MARVDLTSMSGEFKHNHLGQEPRAHGEIHHEKRVVDLNSAPEAVIAICR
ncbi:hypothetical protein [Mesorhizobium sp. ES1-3]|nr:hypothetical protein [Mesorhizobium sp. ES1-3]